MAYVDVQSNLLDSLALLHTLAHRSPSAEERTESAVPAVLALFVVTSQRCDRVGHRKH